MFKILVIDNHTLQTFASSFSFFYLRNWLVGSRSKDSRLILLFARGVNTIELVCRRSCKNILDHKYIQNKNLKMRTEVVINDDTNFDKKIVFDRN